MKWTETPFEPIIGGEIIVFWIIGGFFFGIIAVAMAPESEKPDGCMYWFIFGLILGPIAVLVAMIADYIKKRK